MAQQRRMVYGKIFGSHDLNSLSVEARYLYIAMIVLSDDDGRLNGSEKYLKGQVFSYDDNITVQNVKEWTEALAAIGQIKLYNVGNNQYISHPNWKRYQSIRSDMYVKSRIPKPLQSRNGTVTEPLHKLNEVKLIKLNKSEDPAVPRAFSFPEYLNTMDNDKREAIQLIAHFFRERRISFDTLEQVQQAIGRHIKAANKVIKFPKEKVFSAFEKCKKQHADVDWSLETILKKLTN